MKTKYISKILFASFCLLLSVFTFSSCTDDEVESTYEPTRYTYDDIKSYADLFEVFWTVMDQKYNYFYEQSNMDWQQVYREYYPKFKELKTYGQGTKFKHSEITADFEKAVEYFTDIIDPIIDRHFFFEVALPISSSHRYGVQFRGGMKEAAKNPVYTYDFFDKYYYMLPRLNTENGVTTNGSGGSSNLLIGNLKSEPDILYFAFNQFMLSDNYSMGFSDKYLQIDPASPCYLDAERIATVVKSMALEDKNVEQVLIDKSVECLDLFNTFMNSDLVKAAIDEMQEFNRTEIVTDRFVELMNEVTAKAPQIPTEQDRISNIPEFKVYRNYTKWFNAALKEYLDYACEYDVFKNHAMFTALQKSRLDYYKNFLNPLKRGEIKKLILDLRGNGGGYVADARIFSDRFITKETVFAYQRFKEDNNAFSYTPWAPVRTRISPISMNKEIPIVVLIDKGSASMSEITTLMLRSQGHHVTVVGHYSAGATAALGDSDQFNGGSRDMIAGVMRFNMPLVAMQDADRNVIEGIGIKPDHLLEPLTREEALDMYLSASTHIDRALQKAIEVLQTK